MEWTAGSLAIEYTVCHPGANYSWLRRERSSWALVSIDGLKPAAISKGGNSSEYQRVINIRPWLHPCYPRQPRAEVKGELSEGAPLWEVRPDSWWHVDHEWNMNGDQQLKAHHSSSVSLQVPNKMKNHTVRERKERERIIEGFHFPDVTPGWFMLVSACLGLAMSRNTMLVD